ncbi:histidine kinase [Actinobaculum sp. 313]|uniref:sensor histidine kinase n=1 Tax=Actinobaculum sp. 313 TaxID=2495645 RepID=UPI001F0BD044|nr:histidine kinase [Actinobaculum sp. 313]
MRERGGDPGISGSGRLLWRMAGVVLVLTCVVGMGGLGLLNLMYAAPLRTPSFLVYLAFFSWIAAMWWSLARFRRTVRKRTAEIEDTSGPLSPSAVAELTESRREIVAAFEIERRRIERDLHDGAQQYLVTASMNLGEADLVLDSAVVDGRVVPEKMREVRRLLSRAQDDAESGLRALRNTVAGIHPKVLSDLGLEAAVRNLAGDSAMDVVVRVPHPLPTIPEGVVAAGYFFVAEALTNASKYAPEAHVSIVLVADDDLHLSVLDDGPGGVVIRPDHGLAGMRERLAAFGGSLQVSSPEGGPTVLIARIPLLLRNGEFGVSPSVVGTLQNEDAEQKPETVSAPQSKDSLSEHHDADKRDSDRKVPDTSSGRMPFASPPAPSQAIQEDKQ